MQTQEMISLRAKNLDTLKKFYTPEYRIEGGAKYRAQFFTDGATKQMLYPPKVYPLQNEDVNAKELLLNQPDYAKGLDMDCDIYVTEDPDTFWTECRERGNVTIDGRSGYFDGRSINIFTMKGGLIERWRNFSTRWPIYKAMGIPFTAVNPVSLVRTKVYESELYRNYSRQAFAERNPFNHCNGMVPLTTYGFSSRLAVHDEFDYTPEGQAARERNKKLIYEMCGEKSRAPGGLKWRSGFFGRDGIGTLDFMQEELGRENPLVMYEPFLPDKDSLPDMPDQYEIVLQASATGNPNIVWAEIAGYIANPGETEPIPDIYYNHYAFCFRFLDDGSIYLRREFHDAHIDHEKNQGVTDPELSPAALDFYAGM